MCIDVFGNLFNKISGNHNHNKLEYASSTHWTANCFKSQKSKFKYTSERNKFSF